MLLVSCYSYRSGEEFASFQKENGTFAIKTTALTEKTFFGQTPLGGAYYIFETKARNEVGWREIMVFQHDDPVPINEQAIQFVNDRIAYAHMGWMYAVTTDGGETWNVWNGHKYPLKKGRMGYNAVQDVKLLENGQGTMRLELIGNDDLTELHTKDYGLSWTEEGK